MNRRGFCQAVGAVVTCLVPWRKLVLARSPHYVPVGAQKAFMQMPKVYWMSYYGHVYMYDSRCNPASITTLAVADATSRGMTVLETK